MTTATAAPAAPAFPPCELWDFALAVYFRGGVAPACLALQDGRGADVNLLLFAAWLGASGRGALDSAMLARAEALVAPWRDRVVAPLRAVRRRLKADHTPATPALAAALRRQAAAAEFDAEHVELIALMGLAPASPPADSPAARQRLADAARGACRYLAQLGAPADGDDRIQLRAILAGCFPDHDPGEVIAALDDALRLG